MRDIRKISGSNGANPPLRPDISFQAIEPPAGRGPDPVLPLVLVPLLILGAG